MEASGVSLGAQAQAVASARERKIESLQQLLLKKALEAQRQQEVEMRREAEGKGRFLDLRV